MNIGQLFFGLRADASGLEVDARKAGEAAGATAGLAVARTLGQEFRKGMPGALGNFGTGILQGMGQQAFRGIENAISDVVNAIPNLIAQGKAYATTVHDIQEVTGASAAQSSIFAGTLMSLGIPTENLNANFRILSTQVAANSAVFKANGIATKDAAGVQLNILTIIDNVRQKLSTMTNAAERNALATKLLGRSGLELLDYLKLADPQVQMLTDRLVSYGLVLSQDTVDAAKKSIYEQKQLDLAFTGLGVTLFTVVGPIISSVMSSIAQWVQDNGKTITDVIATIMSALAGLVSGLTGIDMSGMNDFSSKLMELGAPNSGRVGQLESSIADATTAMKANQAIIDKSAASTKADTTAVDANIKSVDAQISALDKRETAQETAYTKSMGRLGKELDAQLALMDAQDKAAALATRDADLQTQLIAAQEDLRKARDTGAGSGHPGVIDRAAELKANEDILTIRGQMNANTIADTKATQRAQLESTKQYIADLAALEKDQPNRKAFGTTLGKRETSLEASLAAAKERGDLVAVADLTARLEAVKTTEVRNNAALRTAAQKDELTKTKADLAELKASIQDSIGGGTSAAVTAAIAANKDLEAEIGRLRGQLDSLTGSATTYEKTGGRLSKPPLGSTGGLATGFNAAAAAGKQFGTDMVTAIQSVIDIVGKLGGALGDLGNGFRYVTDEKFRDIVDAAARAQGKSAPSGAVGDFLGWLGQVLGPDASNSGYAGNIKPQVQGPVPVIPGGSVNPQKNYAMGGYLPLGASGWVGETGLREAVTALPGGGAWITPNAGGSGGIPPHSHPIIIDGRQVALAVDGQLPYLPRR